MKNWTFKDLVGLLMLKAKFATTSLVATVVEYSLYTVFIWWGNALRLAQLLSYGVGMVVNFLLQKRFVFDLKRSVGQAFLGAMIVSLGGMTLNYFIFSWLVTIPFFGNYHYLAKIMATGVVFFYNFYLKRYVFEKRFL